MNNSEKIKAFSEILLLLFNLRQSEVGRDQLPYEQQFANTYRVLYDSVNREMLEQLLPDARSRVKGSFGKFVLCLPVPDHGSIGYPILSVSYNFGCSIPEVSLRVAFLKESDSGIRGYGYRLDPPHGKGRDGGIHHFYHQQVIHSIAGMKFPMADDLKWISEKEPSFPLDAKDCVELLLCLIAALYGRTNTTQILSKLERHIGPKVLDVLKDMKLSEFDNDDLIWFWKYQAAKGDAIYYKTNQQEEAFHEHFKHQHQNHSLIAIMPDEYYDQPVGERKEHILEA